MAIKEEDCGAAGALKEGLFGGNEGKAGHARTQSCLFSQVINMGLPHGCQVELREQLEVNLKADRPTDRLTGERGGCSWRTKGENDSEIER